MRRTYSVVGAALCVIGMVGITVADGFGWWTWILGTLALAGVADAVVMTRRMKH